MPHEIVTSDGSSFRFREYEPPPLGERDVRVRVTFAAPKHGTEVHAITGSVFARKRWDPELRLFLPRAADDPEPPAERPVGNRVVGEVIAVGREVARFAVGDRVYGYGPIREVHQQPEERWRPLAGLTETQAVCTDPAHVALVAVRDGTIRVGDVVAVFGLGAIGLLAAQIARVSGARSVFAVDPLPLRREVALAHGADAAFDPAEEDVGLAIKRATAGAGADIAIETSGSGAALHEAIRCLRPCGIVVHVPWGPKEARDLHLDEEFHLNRITIVGSQAVWGNPDRDHPRWTEARARATVADLFRSGAITADGIVTPIVPFAEALAALVEVFQRPAGVIKLGVRVAP